MSDFRLCGVGCDDAKDSGIGRGVWGVWWAAKAGSSVYGLGLGYGCGIETKGIGL